MAIPGLVAPGMGSFQSGPQIDAAPSANRQALVQAVMGFGAQPLSTPASMPGRQVDNPLEMRPTYGMAMDNLARDAGNSSDPFQALGTRWHPDQIRDPVATGPTGAPALPNATPPQMIAKMPEMMARMGPPAQHTPGSLTQPQQAAPMAGIRRFFGGPAGGGMRQGMPRPRVLARPRFPGAR